MVEISAAIELPTGPDTLWRAVTDWRRQHEWIPATRVRVVRGTGSEVGDVVIARTAAGPLGFDDPMEIVRWEAPRVCVVRHLGRVVRGTGTFAVEPVGDGRSRFTWSEDLTLPFGRAGTWVLTVTRPVSRRLLRLALRRLATTV